MLSNRGRSQDNSTNGLSRHECQKRRDAQVRASSSTPEASVQSTVAKGWEKVPAQAPHELDKAAPKRPASSTVPHFI